MYTTSVETDWTNSMLFKNENFLRGFKRYFCRNILQLFFIPSKLDVDLRCVKYLNELRDEMNIRSIVTKSCFGRSFVANLIFSKKKILIKNKL